MHLVGGFSGSDRRRAVASRGREQRDRDPDRSYPYPGEAGIANVMVEAGDGIALTDFGIAKLVGGTQPTRTGAIVGTPEYLAPDQAMGGDVDQRSDLYALGVVFYEMISGRTPFQADTPFAVIHAQVSTPPRSPMEFNRSIPNALTAVVLRSLAKEPAQRYQSGREFIQALRQALAKSAS